MIRKFIVILLTTGFMVAMAVAEETPATALLVLNKGDNSLAIVDPISLKVVGRVPAGGCWYSSSARCSSATGEASTGSASLPRARTG